MSIVQSQVNDMLVIVKSREAQRAMLAEMRGDRTEAKKHFLATAHLELVLADDYAEFGEARMVFRSRLSAASCFWRAGQIETARKHLAALAQDFPDRVRAVELAISDLEQNCPPPLGKKKPSRKKVR